MRRQQGAGEGTLRLNMGANPATVGRVIRAIRARGVINTVRGRARPRLRMRGLHLHR